MPVLEKISLVVSVGVDVVLLVGEGSMRLSHALV